MAEEDQALKPVRFGSVIYLSTETQLNSFMFSDGFMDDRVILKNFLTINGEAKSHHDFSFCLFMVLPFSNNSCFDVQKKLTNEWRQKLLSSGGLKLEERKNMVADLKNKLESELQFNLGTLQKSKGSNICFGSSNFMLLHVNSLKYLCLYQDDNNNLILQLTNNPDSNCFFDFDASLKLQRGRSDNFVYEDEIVYLSCTEKFSGKSPSICIQEHNHEGLNPDECHIIGAIDDKENWKVNIYEEPLEETSDQFMRVGSVLWILLSEKLLFLDAQRSKDPFMELYEFQNPKPDEKQRPKKKQNKKDQQQQEPQTFLETINDKKGADLTQEFLKSPREHLYDQLRLKVELSEIQEPTDKVGETEELSSFGLWKIEAENVQKGGDLRWDQQYRLKHLLTGMYLAVGEVRPKPNLPTGASNEDDQQKETQYRVYLTKHKYLLVEKQSAEKDILKLPEYDLSQESGTLFEFKPIENLIAYQNKPLTKGLIYKDAFFMIKNIKYSQWIGVKSESNPDDSGKQTIALYNYIKDVNTFRFKEASFQCVWENYSLVSSYQVLFHTLQNTMDTVKMSQETVVRKETYEKKHKFDLYYEKTVKVLEFFYDFLMNRILSNINLEQELLYPSEVRQVKFRQQFILGLICWMLTITFPTLEEFDKLQISPSEESLQFLDKNQVMNAKTVIKRKKGLKQQKFPSINWKTCQDHLLKKYHLSKMSYEVLQAACYQNDENSFFVYNFILKLSDHFSLGEFVTRSYQIIFRDNPKILHSIHRDRFIDIEDQNNSKKNGIHIFQLITGRLKYFEPYKKIEILEILGSLTVIGNSSIYINQEKVFSSLVENKNFLFGHLMKLIYEINDSLENSQVMIEYRVFVEKEYEQRRAELRAFCTDQQQERVMIDYFKAQLRLYALLCQNRNYACIKNMSELLPQQVLMKYLKADEKPILDDDFRAIICFMMLSLYIDKEPRTIISKPNFVRQFTPQQTNYSELKSEQSFEQNEKLVKQIHNKEESHRDKEKDDDMTKRIIEINLSDDIEGTSDIREWLLQYLQDKSKIINRVLEGRIDEYKEGDVFNQLTFEVIKAVNSMVKFGLFTQYATQLMEKAKNQLTESGIGQQITHLDKLIIILADMLEFNYEYVAELIKHDFQRSYVDNRSQEEEGLLGGIGDLAGGLTGDLFGNKEEEEDEEDEVILKKRESKEDTERFQFLKRYQSLNRIIQKFTNKTFSSKEFIIDVKVDYEVLIKREICHIFEILMDWRGDFFIENAIQYFQGTFYAQSLKNESKDSELRELIQHEEDEDDSALVGLMPDIFLGPGQPVKKGSKPFLMTLTTQKPEVRDLDIILDRPFVEILMTAFYFSQDPILQNNLANLIHKIYTQRERLVKNIQKISLVDQQNNNYQKMSTLMNKLKALISYSQSWLQIIEQNSYDEKAEETLVNTLKKLMKMLTIFSEKDKKNHEAFLIRQKVFKHLGGHKILLKFIEQGTSVIDARIDYFKQDKNLGNFSYKNPFIKNVKDTFSYSHKILGTFVEENHGNQHSIYKHYNKFLPSLGNLNVGQVEFLQDLFRNNQDLCYSSSMMFFKYTVGLIRDHGHYKEFIAIFNTFLDVAHQRQDNLEIQKQILGALFNEENVKQIIPFGNPQINEETPGQNQSSTSKFPKFYDKDPDPIQYSFAFIDCIQQCLQVEVGINYLVKVNQYLNVGVLLRQLLTEPSADVNGLTLREQRKAYLSYKTHICDILHIYFSKIDQSIEQFHDSQKIMFEILDQSIEKMCSPKINPEDQIFIGDHVVQLVNVYFEHFLKDIGMIALKMLSNDKSVLQERKVFEFAKILIDKLDKIIGGRQNEADSPAQQTRSKNVIPSLVKLTRNFNIEIPARFTALQEAINEDEVLHTQAQDELEELLTESHTQHVEHQSKRIQLRLKAAKDVLGLQKAMHKLTVQKSKYMQIWDQFISKLKSSKAVVNAIKAERASFPDVIVNVQEMFKKKETDDPRQREMLISRDDMITKFLNYVQNWKARSANRNTIIFFLRAFRILITQKTTEKEIAFQQAHLDNLGTTSIALRLYWKDKSTQDQYIYHLIKLIIQLLDGGNKIIQMSILNLFKSNPDSEAFFRKIYGVLNSEVNRIKRSAKAAVVQTVSQIKMEQKFIEKTLRVIQLLCEGHNNDLQDYLRQQTNSKISYDIVSLMVKLVITHRISNNSYESVLQCLETLTEVVQGPCKENQMVIVTSKFLEWSIDLLREEDKLFDLEANGQHHTNFHQKKGLLKLFGKNNPHESPSHSNHHTPQHSPAQSPGMSTHKQHQVHDSAQLIQNAHEHQGATRKAVHRGNLMRLKYKCTVTLLSLLEMQENNDEIVNRIIRSIPCSVLVSEVTKVHRLFLDPTVCKGEYDKLAFNRYENVEIDPNSESTHADEFIIEYGFNLFILCNILMLKNKKGQDSDLEEINEIIQSYQFVEDKEDEDILASFNVLGNLSNLGGALLSGSLGALKKLGGGDQKAQSELQRLLEKKKQQREAFEFFSQKTAFIEVVRDEEIFRMYFPLLPQCRELPKETKQDFHESVDHSSIRDKLENLMEKADNMIEVMNHEENLRRLFKTSKIIELIANHKALWENLSFISMVIINITIIASYSEYVYTDTRIPYPGRPSLNTLSSLDEGEWNNWANQQQQAYINSQTNPDKLMHARLYEPRFWYQNQYDWTTNMIQIMGLVNLVFSSLVVTFFFLKRAPLLVQNIWIDFSQQNQSLFMTLFLFIKTVIRSLLICCTDFDFVYYSFFITCIVLGLIVHPFLFVFLLVDFLRIQTMKIVVKAIWISKGPMFLSFLVFVLIEYYFTIISFIYYYNDYSQDSEGGYLCDQTWKCFFVTYDQTFKNGGGLGDYLNDPYFSPNEGNIGNHNATQVSQIAKYFSNGGLPINYARNSYQQQRWILKVIYSSSFKFILVIIIINMVAGIIIDTFGALKDNMMETERNLTEYCFICGIEKEKLDKSTQHGYYSHIVKDHHMWNYVYFKAYLHNKPRTEFSGNETYIKRLLKDNEIDWFPVKKALGVTDEEEQDDDQSKGLLLEQIDFQLLELESTAAKTMTKLKALLT